MKHSKVFCPAPWVSFYVDPSGNIENCCVSRNKLGNIEQGDNLKQVLFHGKNQNIQKAMLNGQELEGCSWCYDKSHTLQNRFFDIFPDRNDPLYESGKFELRYLDLRWSNVCNYACIYCGPELSSTWAQEVGETHRIERETKNSMLDTVLEQVDTIKELYLAGGEPTMMKENEILLKELVKRNPDCHVCVNTNLSQTNNRVFELLTQLPNCQWLVSVDASDAQYEYIRYPGKWSDFSNNLNQLSGNVSFNMVFISLNALSIWDTIDDLLNRGHQPNVFTLALYNNGTYPGPWDPRHMSVAFQQRVLERMNHEKYQTMIGWQNIFDYLNAGMYNPDVHPWQYLNDLDQRRGLDSKTIFPEIYQYKDLK